MTSHSSQTDLVSADTDFDPEHSRLLRGILETSLNGTVVYQAVRDEAHRIIDFRFRLFNQTARQDILSRTGRDITGNTLLGVYPDSRESGLFALYARVTETGQSLRLEHHYPEPLDAWYDVSLSKLGDGCVVTFINITESRRATQEAVQNRAQLGAVLDIAQMGIFQFSPVRDADGTLIDFRFTQANRMLAAYVGQTPETVTGALGSTWFPDYKTNGLFDRYRDTYETGRTNRFEFHYDGSGIDVWLDIMATKLGDEVLVTFSDHTALKKAQLQVEEQASLLSSVLDGSPNAIMAYRSIRDELGRIVDFNVVSANAAAVEFLNSPLDTLLGRNLLELFPEEQDMGLFDLYVSTVETGKPGRTEAHYRQDEQWLDISTTRLGDGFVVTFRDITEQKRAAARDELYQQKLKQSNENLERFAYVSSHDLQEPLRKIQSFGDMLSRKHGTQLNEDGRDLIRRMQEAAGRMQALIQDLLAYSRVSSRHDGFQPVDLNGLLRDVLHDLDVVIHEKHARVQISPMPTLQGDPLQLRQLVQNLLSNALKFSRPDAVPVVKVGYRIITDKSVCESVGVSAETACHEITVSDNGIGFEQQYAERIFEAFQRLHGRGDYAGTGIGLAIVKKVVENHRGGVSVTSTPGEGTTFRVYLPVEQRG